jgi:ATP-binding cassette subfamily B protein
MREWRRAVVAVLGLAFAADRRRAWFAMVAWPICGVLGTFSALWLKLLVDGAAGGDRRQVLLAAGLVAVSASVALSGFFISLTAMTRVREEVDREIDQRLIALTGGVLGVAHQENPEYLDRLELLRTGRGELADMVNALSSFVLFALRILVTSALLVSVFPGLLVLPLFALPSLVLTGRAQRHIQHAEERTAADQRRALHLFDLATGPSPAKELRIFGLESTIAQRHRDLRRAVDRQIAKARTAAAVREAAGLLVFGAGYVLAIGLAAREAAAGRATAGDLVLALTAAAGVRDQVGILAWTVGSLAAGKKAVGRYLWLVDHAEAVRRDAQTPGSGPPLPAPDRLTDGIRLSGVGFRYSADQQDALRGVDLHLPAGGVVAVVGENGAGKSTLVKLLARLYEPTSGHLEVDGVRLRRIDPASWRARISAGFEDFVSFELLLREAVGIGNLAALDDDRAVTRALHHAGADDIADQLPDGLVTPLGTSWDGATDLSRGQWQKVALARAMMREEPLLLLLDEPTAALDAETEHALFERYAAAARAVGGRSGAITILVSHRFSTVRMADLIIVIDGGQIVEGGTHAHLLARGGLYAELYEVQAEGYR